MRFLPMFVRADQHSGPGSANLDRSPESVHPGENTGRNVMIIQTVNFYSEGTRLAGDLYLPDGLRPGEKRAGIVLCHGYTGVRNLYLPDTAKALTDAGYVVLTFDYKGWGDSDGPKS